ncbi:MAG: GIY-YIG nuclease family protein [Ignavibacteria bacterium]|nr:GIY-YIG nuclease family protein [Ignavibacteria bacterium]
MWFVYVLRGISSGFRYVGSTNNVDRRLKEHNDGESQSTKAYRPFELESYVAVRSEERARALEKYFKTGSGKAVLYKRILNSNYDKC